MVPLAIRQAWKTMVTGRPGPVVLDVPFDIFKEAAAEETPKPEEWNANISCRCGADPEGVKAVDMLLAAERPVILVGQGVRYGRATADLLRLAERLKIPVAWSASGAGAIDSRHPLALGSDRAQRRLTRRIMRRARPTCCSRSACASTTARRAPGLPGYSFTIPPTKLIHVDIDPDEIGRNYPVALGLMADVRTFLRQVLGELDARRAKTEVAGAANWLAAAIDGYRKQWNEFIAPGFLADTTPIHPQRAAHEIDKALPEDAILVSDIGVHHNWLLQFCKPRRPDSLIGSMGFGPMGFGVAGVLGAKFAAPDRPCVSVCGDGAFFMHASVLGTAFEYDLRSSGWCGTTTPMPRSAACSAATSAAASSRPTFVIPRRAQPYNPDFAAMARSAGIEGVHVDKAADLIRCGANRDPARVRFSSMPISAPTRTRPAPAFGSCRASAAASRPSAAVTNLDRSHAFTSRRDNRRALQRMSGRQQ